MILFVLEGKTEESFFHSIGNILFGGTEKESTKDIKYSFGNNIYNLYKELQEYRGDGTNAFGDIRALLREKNKGKSDDPLKNITNSDISETYLFFDCDFHDRRRDELKIKEIEELLTYFNNETENGKLYINYPMVESIRYEKSLPDPEYYKYTIEMSKCRNFKQIANELSCFKSYNYLEEKSKNYSKNWRLLTKQNIAKANYLCQGKNQNPKSKEDITQQKIFDAELEKFIKAEPSTISILSALPIFLYEYLKNYPE